MIQSSLLSNQCSLGCNSHHCWVGMMGEVTQYIKRPHVKKSHCYRGGKYKGLEEKANNSCSPAPKKEPVTTVLSNLRCKTVNFRMYMLNQTNYFFWGGLKQANKVAYWKVPGSHARQSGLQFPKVYTPTSIFIFRVVTARLPPARLCSPSAFANLFCPLFFRCIFLKAE